jgi:hypothetical protein
MRPSVTPPTYDQPLTEEETTLSTDFDPTTYDHASDPFVSWVVDQIAEGMNEHCDGGAVGSEQAPFGSYARPRFNVRWPVNVLTVHPHNDPEDWAEGSDPDEPWVIDFKLNDQGYPTTPVVRITVERIA